jgi:hypothetical protein
MTERLCLECGSDLSSKRADARFCGPLCKKRWQRKQAKPDTSQKPSKPTVGRKEATPKTEWKPVPVPPDAPLASQVFSMMKSKLQSTPSVIPRGTPIK